MRLNRALKVILWSVSCVFIAFYLYIISVLVQHVRNLICIDARTAQYSTAVNLQNLANTHRIVNFIKYLNSNLDNMKASSVKFITNTFTCICTYMSLHD